MNESARVRHAVGAVIMCKSSILLVHKVKAMDVGGGPQEILGEWDFPKGGVKEGEDIILALHREVYEETGLKNITILKELPRLDFSFDAKFRELLGYDYQHTRMFLMRFEEIQCEVSHQCEEIDEVKFFDLETVPNILFHDSCRDYFNKHIKSISVNNSDRYN